MTNREKRRTAVQKWLKDFATKNVAIKVVALLFAMFLWGYVLTDQKPMRTKTLAEVSMSFDGEAELLSQSLCVRGDRKALLKDVTVAVRTQITNYQDLDAHSVNATISLKNISQPGTYEIPVTATVAGGKGVVQTVTPTTVTVEIDSLRTKSVNVTTSFTGELSDGYWADMDSLSATKQIDINGAKTDVARISRAECTVDLTGRTSTIYNTFDVVLYDAEGNVIPGDIVIGTLPSSTVRLPIYPMRDVPIDVLGSLTGLDNLAVNHELEKAEATPATVRIVGSSEDQVNAIASILLEPIAVNGFNSAQTVEANIIAPEGVRVLDTEPITVLIDVRETQHKKTFEQLPIEIMGQQPHTTVTLSADSVDMTIEGRYSLVSLINRGDVRLFVDVTGLTSGAYTLEISSYVRDEATTVELNNAFAYNGETVTTVTVTITGAP